MFVFAFTSKLYPLIISDLDFYHDVNASVIYVAFVLICRYSFQ